jgi:hypothetical protein
MELIRVSGCPPAPTITLLVFMKIYQYYLVCSDHKVKASYNTAKKNPPIIKKAASLSKAALAIFATLLLYLRNFNSPRLCSAAVVIAVYNVDVVQQCFFRLCDCYILAVAGYGNR